MAVIVWWHWPNLMSKEDGGDQPDLKKGEGVSGDVSGRI